MSQTVVKKITSVVKYYGELIVFLALPIVGNLVVDARFKKKSEREIELEWEEKWAESRGKKDVESDAKWLFDVIEAERKKTGTITSGSASQQH